MSAKEQMLEARELIKAKRYNEARAILNRIDHPTARQWLESLDQLAPQSTPEKSKSDNISYSNDDDWMTPEPARSTRDTLYDDSSARSSDKLTTTGLILMTLATLIAGFGGGILLFLSSKVIWLIFIQVIIACLVAGGIVGAAVQAGKVRVGLIAGLFGALAGFLMYGTYRYAEYLDYRQQEWEYFVNEMYEDPDLQADGYSKQEIDELIDLYLEAEMGQKGYDGYMIWVDQYLMEETGSSGFIGFLKRDAQYGMFIESTRYGSSTNPTELGSELTVGYWVLEILIMVGGSGAIAYAQATKPFCEETGQWLKFAKIGGINKKGRNNFLEVIRMEDYQRASDFLVNPDVQGNQLTIEVARCSEHSPTAMIKITEQRGRSTKELLKKEISVQDYKDLTKNVKSVV